MNGRERRGGEGSRGGGKGGKRTGLLREASEAFIR